MFINHFHVMPAGFMDKERPEYGTIDDIRRLMDEAGMEKAALFAPFLFVFPKSFEGGYRGSNAWLHGLIRRDSRFVGFITLNPAEPQAVDLLGEFAEKGFVGIKFHPPVVQARIDDPALGPFYAKAEELGLPILVHTGVHGWRLDCYRPQLLEKVAQDHPRLKIIVEHMGMFEYFAEALAVVRNNPNCYAGITSILKGPAKHPSQPETGDIQRLLVTAEKWAVGPQRVIYGTDYPYNDHDAIKRDLALISSWKLAADAREAILGGNLSRVIRAT